MQKKLINEHELVHVQGHEAKPLKGLVGIQTVVFLEILDHFTGDSQ